MHLTKESFKGAKLFIPAVMLIFIISNIASAETRTLVRDSIPDDYKWDLSHIYTDWEAWETDLVRLEPLGLTNCRTVSRHMSA